MSKLRELFDEIEAFREIVSKTILKATDNVCNDGSLDVVDVMMTREYGLVLSQNIPAYSGMPFPSTRIFHLLESEMMKIFGNDDDLRKMHGRACSIEPEIHAIVHEAMERIGKSGSLKLLHGILKGRKHARNFYWLYDAPVKKAIASEVGNDEFNQLRHALITLNYCLDFFNKYECEEEPDAVAK